MIVDSEDDDERVVVVGTHTETHYLDSGNRRLCMVPSTPPSPALGTLHDNVPFFRLRHSQFDGNEMMTHTSSAL